MDHTSLPDLLRIHLDGLLQHDFGPIHDFLLRVLAAPEPQLDLELLGVLFSLDKPLADGLCEVASERTGRPVDDVVEALLLVGQLAAEQRLREVRKRDLTGIRLEPALVGLMLGRFWDHSHLVGICAQLLAQRCGISPALAYTAGFFHDLGEIVSDELPRTALRDLVALLGTTPVLSTSWPMLTQADRVIGVSHAYLGTALLQRWGAPAAICEAVLHHHQPMEARRQHRPLAALVHLADVAADCHQRRLPIGTPLFVLEPRAISVLPGTEPVSHEVLRELARKAAILFDCRTDEGCASRFIVQDDALALRGIRHLIPERLAPLNWQEFISRG